MSATSEITADERPAGAGAAEDTAAPAAAGPQDQAPRWWRTDFGAMLVLTIGWQLLMIVLALLIESAMPEQRKFGDGPHTLLSHTFRWDSGWFQAVLDGAYERDWMSPAFYPLFPLAVRIVQLLSLNSFDSLTAGFLLNTVAIWLGATALLKLSRHFLTTKVGPWLVVTVFLTSGSAYFLHLFYSEALFIALGFWAYLFALRRQWTWMGLCLIPLTATRITAVLFVGLCFLEYWRSKNWKLRDLLSWQLLWFPASAIGFLGYELYLRAVTGKDFAMFKAFGPQSSWWYHVFNPNIFETLGLQIQHVAEQLSGPKDVDTRLVVDHVLPLAGLALLLAVSVYLMVVLRGRGVPLGVFGIASFVMFTLNSNLLSVHRYLLPCLGLYLAVVLMGERRPGLRPAVYVAIYAGGLLQTVLYAMIITGMWAG